MSGADANNLESKLLDWLEKSGRGLELRVARTMQQVGGARVRPSLNYVDAVTGAVRESDVVAYFSWRSMNSTPCSLTVAIECKSGTSHPWIGFHKEDPSPTRRQIKDWAVFAHAPQVGIIEPLDELWVGDSPFSRRDPVATHVVTAFSGGNNPAGDAVRQALSCATALREDYVRSQHDDRRGMVLLATVATAAPLFTCQLDDDGTIRLERTAGIDVWGYDAAGQRRRVYIRSEAALDDFALALRSRVEEAYEDARFRYGNI